MSVPLCQRQTTRTSCASPFVAQIGTQRLSVHSVGVPAFKPSCDIQGISQVIYWQLLRICESRFLFFNLHNTLCPSVAPTADCPHTRSKKRRSLSDYACAQMLSGRPIKWTQEQLRKLREQAGARWCPHTAYEHASSGPSQPELSHTWGVPGADPPNRHTEYSRVLDLRKRRASHTCENRTKTRKSGRARLCSTLP